MNSIKWNASEFELSQILKIVERYEKEFSESGITKTQLIMDIEACHCNGCPIDLCALLHATRYEFSHDVAGIVNHIDRTTGNLRDGFEPRHALQIITKKDLKNASL